MAALADPFLYKDKSPTRIEALSYLCRSMVIAVNTRFLMPDELEGCGYFTREVLQILTRQHPGHRFFFLFDRPFHPSLRFDPNVTPLVMGPPARHPLLWKYWFDLRLPRVLKKIKADVFLSPDGFGSLMTRVPQCLVIHDLGFLHYPEGYQRSHLEYMKYHFPRFARKAGTIATVSGFSKKDLCQTYKIDPQKVTIVYNGVREVFQPLGWEEKEKIKERFTGGMEYFLYVGAIQPRKNLIHLLKAFSFFKRRQKSGMKLVIAGRLAWKNNEFLRLLKTFKHRNDVILTGYLDEVSLAGLMASAYALVYPSFFEGFGVPVAEALRCGVPVLTSENSAMQEVAGEAALYFDPASVSEMAEMMMAIYKDEKLRSDLVEKGKEVSRQYTWQRTADRLWTCIQAAVHQKQLP